MAVHIMPDRDSNGEIVTTLKPFAAKGNNSFKGKGVKKNILANTTANIDHTISAGVYKYDAIEILNGDYDDEVKLHIVDDSIGTYSTVPNAVLDEFGNTWNMRKELIKRLPYEATIYTGMIIRVVYTNNTAEDKMVYVNHDLHLTS